MAIYIKYTIKDMHELAAKKGGKCLSKEYFNMHTKLKWQCEKGHVWEAKPASIKKNNNWCRKCGGNEKLTIDKMRIIANKFMGLCLSDKYIDNKTKLIWQCEKGHIFKTRPSDVMRGHWCPKCSGRERLKLKDMQELAQQRGGKCLSNEYTNAHTKLTWQCKYGHVWTAKSNDIRNANRWCPECASYFGERVCRLFFEAIFKRKFPKSRPKWLINSENNQMELDGYCESLKLAFEHQGQQHYRHVEFFHSAEMFKNRKINDSLKEILCKQNGITLVQIPEIPTLLPIKEVKNYIINESIKNGFDIVINEIDQIEIDISDAYTLELDNRFEIIKAIAIENGGECLSKIYYNDRIKLQFKCKKGHTWEAIPYDIKNGHWCPECAGVNRLTIEEMQFVAKEKGGKCLSNEYVNNRSKLIWQCKNGHIWAAAPHDIKQGHWCGKCAKNEKLSIEEMRLLAREKGGKCLSNEYVDIKTKLRWQCSKGHEWAATPNNIKRGTWCKKCSRKEVGSKLKLGIDEMSKIAIERGGKCLSNEYINNKTKLKWQCSKGHIWETTPNTVKSGCWCPICYLDKQ